MTPPALLVLVWMAVAAGARPEPPRVGPLRVVPVLERQAYAPHLSDRAIEWETWEFVFSFSGGYRLLAQFQVSSEGLARQHGLVSGMIVPPEGDVRLLRNSRPRGRWEVAFEAGDVVLALARHRFRIGRQRHRIALTHGNGCFEVEAEATTPEVVAGRVSDAEGERYELTLLAPRLRCRARVQLPGREPVTLDEGWGIAVHALSTQPHHRQAQSVMAFHTFDDPLQVSLFAFAVPHTAAAPDGVSWCVVSRGGGRPLEIVPLVDRRWSAATPESDAPGYVTPRALELVLGPPLAAEARIALRPRARFDLLSWIESAFVRFVAGRSSHPVQYLFDAEYALQTRESGSAPVTGHGLLLLRILNQPRPEWP